jgi:hypothetical protein
MTDSRLDLGPGGAAAQPGVQAGQPGGGPPGAAGRPPPASARRGLLPFEYCLVPAFCLLVLVLHDVSYLLRQPYWTDEAWVAVTTRFPLSRLPDVTSSTPIGWTFLLRLVSFGQGQAGRLLPLAFAALAVVPAYLLARRLDWRDTGTAVAAGSLAAAAVLLVPAMLIRDDLKQYTADACLTLVVLAATSRLERQWSRGGLALVSAAVCGGMLVSDAAALAGAACLGSVCLIELVRRRWRRLAEAAGTAAVTSLAGAGIYAAFDARAFVPALSAYWRAYYIPVHSGLGASVSFVAGRFEYISHRLALGPPWLALLLLLAGLVTIARLGRPATALAAAALWAELVALAALGKYPFLDVRTSTFLTVATAVIAAIGVAGACSLARAWLRGGRRRGPLGTAAAAVLAAAALAAFTVQAVPFARGQPIPPDNIRQQARYVAARGGPADPVVVSSTSSWGFAYYWPLGRPERVANPANLQGYTPVFPARGRIVVARDRTALAVGAALARALAQIRPGACGRIWLVRTRLKPAEAAIWRAELIRLRLTARAARYGLAIILAGPPRCRGGTPRRG